jgi:hypothetical protein
MVEPDRGQSLIDRTYDDTMYALKNTLILKIRCDPRRVFSCRALLQQCEGISVRVEQVAGNELGKPASEDCEVDHCVGGE